MQQKPEPVVAELDSGRVLIEQPRLAIAVEHQARQRGFPLLRANECVEVEAVRLGKGSEGVDLSSGEGRAGQRRHRFAEQ